MADLSAFPPDRLTPSLSPHATFLRPFFSNRLEPWVSDAFSLTSTTPPLPFSSPFGVKDLQIIFCAFPALYFARAFLLSQSFYPDPRRFSCPGQPRPPHNFVVILESERCIFSLPFLSLGCLGYSTVWLGPLDVCHFSQSVSFFPPRHPSKFGVVCLCFSRIRNSLKLHSGSSVVSPLPDFCCHK